MKRFQSHHKWDTIKAFFDRGIMTNDILPKRRYNILVWISAITACFLIAGTGAATAAIRYDSRHRTVVLPGVSVGGVSLGGLDFAEAKARIVQRYDEPLTRNLYIEAGGKTFTTTPRELGVTSDALDVYKHAVVMHGGMPVFQRVWHRLTGMPMDATFEAKTSIDRRALSEFVQDIGERVDRQPSAAQLAVEGDTLQITPDVDGFLLDRESAEDLVEKAALSGATNMRLEGKTTPAPLKRSDIKDVLVVKIGENKLVHYQGEQIVKVYDVATGMSRFPTPRGQFKIVNKRFRPTWVNPAKYPGGWGFKLPAKILPGPGNPLGTRAMDLNAPGVRIHGTYSEYSMGYNASHGCIRMRIAEAEELFGLVEVGTPVLIVQTAAYRAMPSRLKPATPEPLAEADGTQIPGQSPTPPPATTEPSPSPAIQPL